MGGVPGASSLSQWNVGFSPLQEPGLVLAQTRMSVSETGGPVPRHRLIPSHSPGAFKAELKF